MQPVLPSVQKKLKALFGKEFDISYDDLHCGEENWELAERRLMSDSIQQVMQKANVETSQIDFFLAGDLLNQTVTANYVARKWGIPFLGMFSACATSMETLAVGSAFIDGGFANRVLATVSSHNATAERQFRYPTEYGGQKPGTANSTVTGAGSILISKEKVPLKLRRLRLEKYKI